MRDALIYAQDSVQNKSPTFIVAIQAEGRWVETDLGLGTYSQETVKVTRNILMVVDLLKQLTDSFSIDPTRMMVSGVSMGGFVTWDIITRYLSMFAAAAPISSCADTTKTCLIKDIRIWTFIAIMMALSH